MRINKFVANSTGLSRRAADKLVDSARVTINGRPAQAGQQVVAGDTVKLDGAVVKAKDNLTIILNKPVGYVVSREGQGSKTIYDLLPPDLHALKPVGRLDKNSSGLLLITNDGKLANNLTHPKFSKLKVYNLTLDKPLTPADQQAITKGLMLDDGPSRLELHTIDDPKNWQVRMSEGRNRQIRRTFEALGYTVLELHRTDFGPFTLGDLKPGKYHRLSSVRIEM